MLFTLSTSSIILILVWLYNYFKFKYLENTFTRFTSKFSTNVYNHIYLNVMIGKFIIVIALIYYGIKVKFIKKSVTIFTIYSIREYGFKSDIITSKIYLRNNGEVWRNLLQSIPFIPLKMTNKSYFHKSIILLRNKL